MPDYIIFDPTSAPVAGRVTAFRKSWPKEREAELGLNILENPDTTGITLQAAKVVAGVLSNLTQGELDTIAATEAAASTAALKLAAKNIFITPDSPENQAIKLGFETVLEMMASELNILRAGQSLTARTASQVKTAFRNTYEEKIDNL
jgi:soluble cytochrome b562